MRHSMDTVTAHGSMAKRHICCVNASIIQGSGVGPVMYVVNAADLQAVTLGNIMVKYADE